MAVPILGNLKSHVRERPEHYYIRRGPRPVVNELEATKG